MKVLNRPLYDPRPVTRFKSAKYFMKVLTVISAAALAACGKMTTPISMTKSEAQTVVDSIEYVKAKNGICFGLVTMERVSTNGAYTQNVLMTSVDCKLAGL